MFWLKCWTWNNGRSIVTQLALDLAFNLFHPSIHNITTDLGDLLPTAPHKISFSDPHWATPNLCLGFSIFQRRASDGQIFQRTFFRLLKNLSVLPHSSSNVALLLLDGARSQLDWACNVCVLCRILFPEHLGLQKPPFFPPCRGKTTRTNGGEHRFWMSMMLNLDHNFSGLSSHIAEMCPPRVPLSLGL